MGSEMPRLFFAAPFTQMLDEVTNRIAPDYREWLSDILRFLENLGFKVISSHRREKWGEGLLTPAAALDADIHAIEGCDLLVAYLGDPPSPGVQLELGVALACRKRLILLTESGLNLPYLLNGIPDVGRGQIIRFRDTEDLFRLLTEALQGNPA